ncbi:MAG: hypothetical protein V1744_00055 [Candidatus Altiarchaeota archaeon]
MDIDELINKGELKRQPFSGSFAVDYMAKARKNLAVMKLLEGIQNNPETRVHVGLSKDVNLSDWVIITGYYSMYMAAQAALARIGYLAKSHAAMQAAIKVFYVDKMLVEPKYLKILEEANIRQEQVKQFREARAQRQTAQYEISIRTLDEEAKKIIDTAFDFVNRFDEAIGKR